MNERRIKWEIRAALLRQGQAMQQGRINEARAIGKKVQALRQMLRRIRVAG